MDSFPTKGSRRGTWVLFNGEILWFYIQFSVSFIISESQSFIFLTQYALQFSRSVLFSSFPLKVVGIPLMMLQHFSCILLCLPLPWGNIQSLVYPQIILAPFTFLCRIVFDMQDNLAMWPYQLRFRIFIMARRLLCTLIESWILLQTSSIITWSCRRYLEISALSLLLSSAVRVKFSQA